MGRADTVVTGQPDVLMDVTRGDLARDATCDMATEEMLINMGPQHPSTHGVLRVVLRTDGEMVLEAIPHIGYLHRCAEKLGENLQPFQYIPKTDRMDYLAAMNNNHAYSLAVEKLAGLQVPPNETKQLAEFLKALGYRYWDETENPAYRLFLR